MSDAAPPGTYTRTAAVLHWPMAVLIIANLIIGFTDGKVASIATHKSIGLSVLMLAIVRIGWRLAHRPPPLPEAIKRFTRTAARAMHLTLYALMLAVPLTGWLCVSNAPKLRPLRWFGLFQMPYLSLAPSIYAPAKSVHAALAIGLAIPCGGAHRGRVVPSVDRPSAHAEPPRAQAITPDYDQNCAANPADRGRGLAGSRLRALLAPGASLHAISLVGENVPKVA